MLSRGGILLLPRVVSVYLPFQKERKEGRKGGRERGVSPINLRVDI